MAYIIESALAARTLGRVVVSTEDAEIARVAESLGAEVPFLRPAALSTDEVSLIPVVQHAMQTLDDAGWRADVVVSLQPTCPFTTPAEIDAAVDKLVDTGCDAVVSVLPILRGHPYRAKTLEGDRLRPFWGDLNGDTFLQRQDLPAAYCYSGAIFVRRRFLLEEWSGKDFALGDDCRAVVVDPSRAVNIDGPLDFQLAELLVMGFSPAER